MPDEIRINRPSAAGGQPSARPEPAVQPENSQTNPVSKTPWIILGLVVAVILLLGVLFRDKLFSGGDKGKMTAAPSQVSGYQAVFLTNGQVYFGKISNAENTYVTLKDIYYLQVGPQQGSGTAAGQAAQTPQQSISLVKLGNELHGPVDEMHISRSQILFYEDLKAEGAVVKAIEAYKASPGGAPAQ